MPVLVQSPLCELDLGGRQADGSSCGVAVCVDQRTKGGKRPLQSQHPVFRICCKLLFDGYPQRNQLAVARNYVLVQRQRGLLEQPTSRTAAIEGVELFLKNPDVIRAERQVFG